MTLAVMPELDLARYVKRCVRCRRVQGNSSFTRRADGQRWNVCRGCRSVETADYLARRHRFRQAIRRLATLTAREAQLAKRLETIRAAKRTMELEIMRHEQPDLLPAEPAALNPVESVSLVRCAE